MVESLKETPGALLGLLERADRAAVSGWAADAARPGVPVMLEVWRDGALAGRIAAADYRQDLADGGLGEGRHAFMLHLPAEGLPSGPIEIRVYREADGAELPGSPLVIPAGGAEPAPHQAIADAITAAALADGPDGRDGVITVLAREVAALLLTLPATAPRAAFAARWGGAAAAIDTRKRALFIDDGVPDATRDAGSNAVLSHMRALLRLGFQVDFVAGYALDAAGAPTAALEGMGVTCWHAPWIGSVEEVLRRLGPGLEVAYLHRYGLMQRYAALVRRWCPRARLLYCVADLHHLRLARRQAIEAGLPPDAGSPSEAVDGLRTAELLAALGADAVITHSSFEAAVLRREVPEAAVHLVPWDVPVRATDVPFADRAGVAFIGSYGHAPNLDAAHEFVEAVMPLVWARAPDIRCVLAGSDLPASVREAAARAGGPVEVLGYLPDLGVLWERVRLTAAPLRFGAGLKGKVLDSLAAGIPCVCSPMAAEGMDLPGDLEGLVAETPEAMAAVIVWLHGDAADNAAMARAGLQWVGAWLSEERIGGLLEKAALA